MRSSRDQDLVNVSLDGRQVVGVVVGTLVVLSVTFALGTTFGRRLAAHQPTASVPADLGSLDQMTAPVPTFAFGELLAKSDPAPVVETPTRPKPPPKPEPKPEPQPANASSPTPPEPVAEEVPAPPAAPRAQPIDALAKAVAQLEAPPQAAPLERPAGSWSVQFGASQEQAEADRLAAKLLGQGLLPFVVTAEIPGKGTFYRVRVGQFADKQEADALLSRAKGLGLQGLVMPVK